MENSMGEIEISRSKMKKKITFIRIHISALYRKQKQKRYCFV